ncbi:hypothetical protein X943_000002 [Babesia divergens]|uniref:Uncharacterized protein n=1 Tax=Babesia divergens TaxID=32595 RepID=A0AAD9LDN1_BABDI|nr:hypothetical protein X943_000002 [Babesia divergens]
MERLSHNTANKLSFFGEWRVIDESEFMSPTAAAMRAESDYSQVVTDGCDLRLIQKDLHDLQSTLTSPQGQLAGKLQEMNRETTEQLDRARQKFNAIETIWRENNFQRYLDAEQSEPAQQLSQVDRKLAQAVREVVGMKRDAETALMELTKSVASVDNLIGKSNQLKRSSCTFRQTATIEKNSAPMSLKMQLLVAAILSFLGYSLLKYLGW